MKLVWWSEIPNFVFAEHYYTVKHQYTTLYKTEAKRESRVEQQTANLSFSQHSQNKREENQTKTEARANAKNRDGLLLRRDVLQLPPL